MVPETHFRVICSPPSFRDSKEERRFPGSRLWEFEKGTPLRLYCHLLENSCNKCTVDTVMLWCLCAVYNLPKLACQPAVPFCSWGNRARRRWSSLLSSFPLIARSDAGSSCGGMAAALSRLTAFTCTSSRKRPRALILPALRVYSWPLGVRW